MKITMSQTLTKTYNDFRNVCCVQIHVTCCLFYVRTVYFSFFYGISTSPPEIRSSQVESIHQDIHSILCLFFYSYYSVLLRQNTVILRSCYIKIFKEEKETLIASKNKFIGTMRVGYNNSQINNSEYVLFFKFIILQRFCKIYKNTW